MRQQDKASLQNGVKGGDAKTVFVAAYPHLKESWDKASPFDVKCSLMDYPLEEEELPDTLDMPCADKLVILLPDDVRSHVLLRYIARDFKGEIFIVPICGQYTDMAPLAVSDAEYADCIKNRVTLSESKRKELCSELSEIITLYDCCWKLQDGRIRPLPRKEVYDYIIGQLEGEMKISHIVGICMGNAPKGWPITDVFYLNRIDEIIGTGHIAITKDNDNPFQRYIKPR